MKKLFFVLIAAIALLSLFTTPAQAARCDIEHVNTSVAPTTPPTMAAAHPEVANSLVICGQYPDCKCELVDFFWMLRKIYIFITWTLAIPLGGLLMAIGGGMMIVSGGNPALFDRGKGMLWGAFWGVALVFGAWVIISVVLLALGINTNPGNIQFN